MSSTTIIIPGRETQTIPGLTMTAQEVISAFAGEISLSSLNNQTDVAEDGSVTITFSNKTGTKGSDVHVSGDLVLNVSGDVNVTNTRIVIPGREAQDIPGIVMSGAEVRSAFAGTVELSSFDCSECDEDDFHVITFSNKTGTKGQVNIMDVIQSALLQEQQNAGVSTSVSTTAAPAVEVQMTPQDVVAAPAPALQGVEGGVGQLNNTRIAIPGREDQLIVGMVLDAQLVKDSFAGELDLSGYDVEETESGDTLNVVFTARTGTKGA